MNVLNVSVCKLVLLAYWKNLIQKMKHCTHIKALFVFAICAVCSTSLLGHYHVWKSGLDYDQEIDDIRQWAADNFSDGQNGDLDYWELKAFELDIDHDGIPEVFLTTPKLHGTGGGPHLVFRKDKLVYFYIGQLGGREQTMRVLPLGSDGTPRVMTFGGNGGSSGIASVWKNDGKRFVPVSTEVIRSGDSGTEEGRKRFEELFGKPTLLTP